MLLTWLAVLSAVCAVFFTRMLWKRWQYDLHKIPAPPSHPILGHMLGLMKEGDMNRFVGRWWKKLGCPKILKVDITGGSILHITDAEFLRSVVFSKTNPFPRGFVQKNGIVPMTGNDYSAKCLVNTVELTPYVKAMRKVYATGLQSNNLRAAVPKVHGVMDKMIDIIEHQRSTGAVDFQGLCVKMTLDTIGVVAFDANLGGLDNSRELYRTIIEGGHHLSRRFAQPVRNIFRSLLPNAKVSSESGDILDELTAEWEKIAMEILEREDAPPDEEPIWSGLKRFSDPETGESLPYKSLVAEVGFAVIAGMDTTGHQLAWILALLASNPDKAEKLIDELKSHGFCGRDARNVTIDDLGELSYLTAIVKEGMRIAHVLSSGFLRDVPRDMKILGYRLPAGVNVCYPGSRSMCSEAEWGDPDVFRPERWLTDEDMSQKLYLGFSYGPRDCIGQRLAMMEMRVALIRLVSKYRFSPTVTIDDLLNNTGIGIVIEAKDGIWLNASPRDCTD